MVPPADDSPGLVVKPRSAAAAAWSMVLQPPLADVTPVGLVADADGVAAADGDDAAAAAGVVYPAATAAPAVWPLVLDAGEEQPDIAAPRATAPVSSTRVRGDMRSSEAMRRPSSQHTRGGCPWAPGETLAGQPAQSSLESETVAGLDEGSRGAGT